MKISHTLNCGLRSFVPTLIFLSLLVLGTTAPLGAEDEIRYLVHPDDLPATAEPTTGKSAALAEAFLSGELRPDQEISDVFRIPKFKGELIPDTLSPRILANYRTRHSWGQIPLKVTAQVLEATKPAEVVRSPQKLGKLIEEKAGFRTWNIFSVLVFGDASDDPERAKRVIMETFFDPKCRHLIIEEVGDGDQLSGFLLLGLRETAEGREIVGLVIVAD